MHLPTSLPPPPAAEMMKEQVVDRVPRTISELKFGILSKQDIVKQSVLELTHGGLYELEAQGNKRDAQKFGPLDNRLGPPRGSRCPTCNELPDQCSGHFGWFRLALPVFHVGYFKLVITVLQSICKDCGHILLSEHDRRSFLRKIRQPNLDNLARTRLCRKILEQCKKTGQCFRCGATNGTVKKAGSHPLKVIHDKYRKFNTSKAIHKQEPRTKTHFDSSFKEARKDYADLNKHQKKAMDDMNPLRVLKLFRQITSSDCELLGMDPEDGRPEMFIWQYIPAPPVAIRPSVAQELTSTEDDITAKLTDIIRSSNEVQQKMDAGQPIHIIMEKWDLLQLQLAIYINSDLPGLQHGAQPLRGFCQRLKGKQGRFRGNLSGKRVNFSGRTVISPDPNLAINEVSIPQKVARNLTYPEKVTPHNIQKLELRVRNGPRKYPGAVNIIDKSGRKYGLKFHTTDQSKRLRVGYVVERHLEDGDIVLFNRQPSLHKISIMCHFVKVRPHRTFRLNEAVCNPYNADFDGDEMNLHVPQTEEARTEAKFLMDAALNIATPKNGEPIIAAIQDFITCCYLLSNKDKFFDRKAFTTACMSMVDGNMQIDLPRPAIMKPEMLWTGKQIFSVMMRPNKASSVQLNLEAPCREFKPVKGQPNYLSANDAWLCIQNSELLCGVLEKSNFGSGNRNSIIGGLLRDFGSEAAMSVMSRLAKLASRQLGEEGFSIGISDVYPGGQLLRLKTELVEKAYAECDELIVKFKEGRLARAAGCDEETTLENLVSGLLSKVRENAGNYCISELSKHNAPLIMASSGAKGSNLNVSQMVAAVGQQIIGGKRVSEGFQDRALPHFPKHSRNPPSKGFVRNSFFSGLTPSEFLFHAMSGREGLVDTAVKTAETGYMSRRLIKALEDVSSQYDRTTRNSAKSIVQFRYGDDLLDPVNMEGKAKPVDFERVFMHCRAMTDNEDVGLQDISEACEALLVREEDKYQRYSMTGKPLQYNDPDIINTDEYESVRTFLDSIRQFVRDKADALTDARRRLGLPFDVNARGSSSMRSIETTEEEKAKLANLESTVNKLYKVSQSTLKLFVQTCITKYLRAQVEPGHAVGVVGAQSIGEPGTQMTLKTFHFAGVAGTNIMQGVPRIKEIINATERISTPLITCELQASEPFHGKLQYSSLFLARRVKGRLEKTFVRDILHEFRRIHRPDALLLRLHVDRANISNLQLEVTLFSVKAALEKSKKLSLQEDVNIDYRHGYIDITLSTENHGYMKKPTKGKTLQPDAAHHRLDTLERLIPQVCISGYPEAHRAVITQDEKDNTKHRVLVEGYGLRECLNTLGVDFRYTRTNSVIETFKILGIEAARSTIISEISSVMRTMGIDPRHFSLLGDVMTQKGEITGITRFGMAKMRDSVLQLASFEKTPDHLFEAAWHKQADSIKGVSEAIILGQEVDLGTGASQVIRDLRFEVGDIGMKKTVFEDTWQELRQGRGRKRTRRAPALGVKEARNVDVDMVM